jgi:hypothetical protein
MLESLDGSFLAARSAEEDLLTALGALLQQDLDRLRSTVALLDAGVLVRHGAWPIRKRTRTGVERFLANTDGAPSGPLTFGRLNLIPNFGVKSMLDLLCVAEAADELASAEPDESEDPDGGTELRILREGLQPGWAEQISGADPRFVSLPTPAALDELLAAGRLGRAQAQVVSRQIDESAAVPFDRSLRELVAAFASLEGDRLDALVARLGLGGEPPITLEATGKRLNVTRERIRQIEAKMLARRPPHPIWLPALDEALRRVQAHAPLAAEGLTALLLEYGLTERPFGPEAFLAALELARHDHDLRISGRVLTTGESRRTASDRAADLASFLEAISGLVRTFRVSNVQAAAAAVARTSDGKGTEPTDPWDPSYPSEPGVAERDVRRTLDELGAAWLDDEWFWLREQEDARGSALLRLIANMLSVAADGTLSIADLREGVRRRFVWRGMGETPTRSALLGFCELHDELVVDRDRGTVTILSPIPLDRAASPSDRALIDVVLSAPGQVVERIELLNGATTRGVNESTATVYTTYSPFLKQIDLNIWGVRGIDPDPERVAELTRARQARPRGQRTMGFRWVGDRTLQVAVRVPSMGAGVFLVPAAARDTVKGRAFEAFTQVGDEVGTLKVDDASASSWGLLPFVRRSGAEAGDVIVIEFDLDAGVAVLELLGAEILEGHEFDGWSKAGTAGSRPNQGAGMDDETSEPIVEEYFDNAPMHVEAEAESDEDLEEIDRPWNPESIRVSTKSFSLRNVLDFIDEETLELAPDFQRSQVWTPVRRSQLIESVLLQIPLPVFYFAEDNNGVLRVVDGLQRLSSIHTFVRGGEDGAGGFKLRKLEYLTDANGKSWKDLPPGWRRRLETTQIVAHVVDPQTPNEVMYDIFRRINTGGVPLNAQEIRHCMSRSRSRDFLRRCARTESLRTATGGVLWEHPRMVDRELVLRFAAFWMHDAAEYERDAGTMERFLAEATSELDRPEQVSDADLETIEGAFKTGCQRSAALFGEFAFRKWPVGEEKKRPINKSLFEAWAVQLARLSDEEFEQLDTDGLVASARRAMVDDFAFLTSITSSTGDPRRVRQRFQTVSTLLAEARG